MSFPYDFAVVAFFRRYKPWLFLIQDKLRLGEDCEECVAHAVVGELDLDCRCFVAILAVLEARAGFNGFHVLESQRAGIIGNSEYWLGRDIHGINSHRAM